MTDAPEYACNTCLVSFPDYETMRAHYKTDWHIYNSRRKVAGLAPIQNTMIKHYVALFVLLLASSNSFTSPPGLSLPSSAYTKTNSERSRLKSSLQDPNSIKNGSVPTVPSPLNDIIESRRSFELQLGKSIDVLNHDYPLLLVKQPVLEIYNDKITVIDPSGVQAVRGVDGYKVMFGGLRMAAGVFFSSKNSFIEHNLVYDWVRSQIRVTFKITLVPKADVKKTDKQTHQEQLDLVLGKRASANNNHVTISGVSEYYVDSEGKIVKHIISNVVINNKPVTIGLGMGDLFAMQQGKLARGGATGGYGFSGGLNRMNSRKAERDVVMRLFSSSSSSGDIVGDEELAKKNEARAKFGLKPISREELEEIERGNREVLMKFNQNRDKEAGDSTAISPSSPSNPSPLHLMGRIFDAVTKDIDAPKKCKTWEDCDEMECCDLIVTKVCCNTGLGSPAWMPDLVPVKIDDDVGEGWDAPRNGPY